MILRVFPRRTKATPIDDYVRVGEPGLFDPPTDVDGVHVSVAFTWDLAVAERLVKAWSQLIPDTLLGGPACGDAGGVFEPGKYLGTGHILTSRGCPNRCWFCYVWKREGDIRELPILDGWKIHDSNLLACSREHVEAVFAMLSRQPHRPEFLGGLEAARLEPWHLDWIDRLKPRRLFVAYDTPDSLEPLRTAGRMLAETGCRELYCYVLIGFDGDSFEDAESRLYQTIEAGFIPYAMLFRNDSNRVNPEWRRFQREWVRPAIVRAKMRQMA